MLRRRLTRIKPGQQKGKQDADRKHQTDRRLFQQAEFWTEPHIQLSHKKNRDNAESGKAYRVKKYKNVSEHQQQEMFQAVPFRQFVDKKGAEHKISNVQNIRMREAEAPPENMSKPHLLMNAVYRMFQPEKGKYAQQNGAQRPYP